MSGKIMWVLFILVIVCIVGVLTFWESPVGIIFAYALGFIFFLIAPVLGLSFSEFGMPEWLGWLAWFGAWALLFIIGAVILVVLGALFGGE